MLTTTGRRTTRGMFAALVMAVLCVGWGLPATMAVADPDCRMVEVKDEAGRTTWVEQCDDEGGDDGGNDGGDNGGNPPPSCDLDVFERVHDGASRWCEGTTACWGNFPSVLDEDSWEERAKEPRPGPDHIVTYVVCQDENGETVRSGWQWTLPPEEQGPSLWDLAWLAHGQLETPNFGIAISPPDTTYVGLDTWFWADGPAAEVITGSSGSVTAIAEPDRIEVDPGDGSSGFTCSFEVAENDRCFHSYAKASVNGAYPAQMRLVYSLRFENGGETLTLEGLPTSLESPWVGEAIPVGEIQGTVVG